MSYIQPKTDYQDGDILYGIDLNASNATIKAGVDDNFDRIQGLETSKQDNLTAGEGIEITEDNVINNTQTSAEWGNVQGNIEDQTDLIDLLEEKQDTLVSGTNIKTINNQDILGEGNISIGGSGGTSDYDHLENRPQINNVTLTGNKSLADLGINIPTKLSDLTNDNNTVTDENYVHTDNNYTDTEKNKLAGVDDIIVVGDETSATSQTELLFEEEDLDAQYAEEKNIISATFTTNHTIASTNPEKVNLNSSNSVGTKLTLSNSGIVIGSGVSKVKVCANINFQTVTSGQKELNIYLNDAVNMSNVSVISGRTTLALAHYLMNVQEGDVIYLYATGASGDVLRRNMQFSNITVEVVE